MTRIFVSGGGGFIGRNVIPKLLAQGHSVLALQRRSAIVPAAHDRLTIVEGDLARIGRELTDAAKDCDTLLHLAGDTTPVSSANDFDAEYRVNIAPLTKLLDVLNDTAIKRAVLLSSGGTVYGRPRSTPIDESHPTAPTTPYGLGKLACEHLVRLWATRRQCEHIVLRAANPYGPYQLGRNDQGVIGVWLQRVLAGLPLVVRGDGSAVRDYLYVSDLADALCLSCTDTNLSSDIYNVGSGQGFSLLQIAEAMERVTGKSLRLEFVSANAYDVAVNVLCNERFFKATGWRPNVGLIDGMQLTAAHFANAKAVTPSVDR